jgi:outer membrane protein assembly factor BamA
LPHLRLALALALLVGAAAPSAAGEFGPRYVVERIEIRGNTKTARALIERELQVRAGDVVGADDERVELSRFRLLALGFFTDVRLGLKRGAARGQAVLVVDVVERGTIVLNQIFLGTSDAVPLWGGVDVSENNLAGRGVALGGAFLFSTRGNTREAHPQQAYRLRLGWGRLFGRPVSASTTVLYNDAVELYRTAGAPSDGAPDHFTGVHYRRIGGAAALGFELGATVRLQVGYRLERVLADVPDALVQSFPDGRTAAVDVGLRPGGSFDSTASIVLERDTRSEPALPLQGSRVAFQGELSTPWLGSSYEYYKLTVGYQVWFRLPWGHALSLLSWAGVIVGDAPIFDRFYIGDVNPLVPPRALGLTFSTQPSRNLLGAGISGVRYGVLGGRLGTEYLWPVFRGGTYFYGGHLFAGMGVLGLARAEDLRDRPGGSVWSSLPVDLYFDAGLRLDTFLGVFHFSVANFLGRLPY